MKDFNEHAMIQELNLQEEKEINGGGFLVGVLVGAAVSIIVDQWPDIKKGVSDAWNGI